MFVQPTSGIEIPWIYQLIWSHQINSILLLLFASSLGRIYIKGILDVILSFSFPIHTGSQAKLSFFFYLEIYSLYLRSNKQRQNRKLRKFKLFRIEKRRHFPDLWSLEIWSTVPLRKRRKKSNHIFLNLIFIFSWLMLYLAMIKGITESPKVVYVS